MRSYLRLDAIALPFSIGSDQPDGSRKSDGTAGYICHGPYTSLSAGKYTAGLYLKRVGTIDVGTLLMDAVADYGNVEIGKRSIQLSDLTTTIAGLVSMDFDIKHDMHDVEIRLWVPDRVEVQLRELVLFRRNALDWSF